MKYSLFCISLFSSAVLAEEITYSVESLQQNQSKTEALLMDMLSIQRFDLVERLLPIYQGFSTQNPRLVNYAKIRLAQNAFWNYRHQQAKQSLQAVNSQQNLTDEERRVVEEYLHALSQRDRWQFSAGGHYIYNKNVNNVSNIRQIEDTGFIKNDDMMPQSARGIAYSFNATRNWNVVGSHYLHFSNDLAGKYYWDNHFYDEINNRTYLGYLYQTATFKGAIKPFYEHQWQGKHRHNKAKGLRLELQKSVAKQWQFSAALEWNQPRYFSQREKDGIIKLISTTLIWYPSQQSYIYLGTDFMREQVRVKQYSNDTKTLRLGWQKHWNGNIVTQINGSISQRRFKDLASLGGVLPLGKVRQDKIYSANLTLWKSDWKVWGLTPKIQLRYKSQNSNIPSMFSYTDKNIQILIEKEF